MTSIDNETQIFTQKLSKHIKSSIESSLKLNQTPNYYIVLRNSILKTFIPSLLFYSFIAFLGDALSIFYIYFIGEFIRYIEDEGTHYSKGIWLIVFFFLASAFSQIFRSQQYFLGYKLSLVMRKSLMCLLFDKIGNLSMKSLIDTNSGKLISLISSELFAVERGLANLPMVISAPFTNILCYIVIGMTVGWWYSLAIFLSWILIYLG